MRLTTTCAIGLILMGTAIRAQDYIPLFDYIEQVDNTEVTFSGAARYDPQEDTFTFYDENRNRYLMTMDAGRKARELVQQTCENRGFSFSYSELCSFEANGTIEIRGGRLQLSVDEVLNVAK